MVHAISSDGTRIAYAEVGTGPAFLIVGGAFSTADAGLPLAEALAQTGLRGVVLDRRGRAGSGDTPPYAPEREAEDLASVIEAVRGVAGVVGHSSGAVLALFAASVGVPTGHLFLSEPPFRFGEDAAWDLAERMQVAIDGGRPEAAVTAFQREAVGLPEPVLEQIRASPMFATLVPLAQSAVYDVLLTRAVSTPTAAMASVAAPVTILRGEPTFPILVTAIERLADRIPSAEVVIVPESHDHSVDPAGTAREIAARQSASALPWTRRHQEGLVGRSAAEAQQLVEGAGWTPRVARRDGAVTTDLRPRRVTLWVDEDHIVRSVTAG